MSYRGMGQVLLLPLAMAAAKRRRASGGWPKDSLAAYHEMVKKYGPPTGMSDYGAIWNRPHGPWKRSVVVKHGFRHNWPSPHMDVLLQTIDYRVPPSKFTQLAMYDGSIIAERTAGELSARCGNEKMNFVAINLAHDVVTGRRTVAQARKEYARVAKLVGRGQLPRYAAGLIFRVPSGYQGDPDVAVQGLGLAPSETPIPWTPTTAFAQAVDPYSFRFSPPGAVFAPYGWGPDFNIGMPASYTHHLSYERTPIPGARRNIGTMYDVIWPYAKGTKLGNYEEDYAGIFDARGAVDTGDDQQLGDSGDGLGGILAVM